MLKELTNLITSQKDYYLRKIIRQSNNFNFRKNKKIILFGAAEIGKVFIKLFTDNNIVVMAVCDNDLSKRGKRLHNVMIISPDDLLKFPKDTPIIITVMHDQEVKKQLKSLGFNNSWRHGYFSTLYPRKFQNNFWGSSINTILTSNKEILSCFNLFKDSVSQKTFFGVLRYRLTLDNNYLKEIMKPIENQYFDKDVVSFSEKEVYVDGGAFTGDTIIQFFKHVNKKFLHIYAFEPDRVSFATLKKNIRKVIGKRISLLPIGLEKKETSVSFYTSGEMSSRITTYGENKIKVINLDKFLSDKIIPTFIKLDLEGVDYNALIGMKNILSTYQPKLAISVYHTSTDLWKIPLLIRKINPNYKFFLRHYSETLHETICYAV